MEAYQEQILTEKDRLLRKYQCKTIQEVLKKLEEELQKCERPPIVTN